jgi:hypothetical protein
MYAIGGKANIAVTCQKSFLADLVWGRGLYYGAT